MAKAKVIPNSSPSGIAKDVDVGRPEIEALENVGVPSALVLCVFDSPFNADGRCHLMNAWDIEGRGQTNGFGKFGHAIGNDTVQGFAPPIVRRNVQARDGPSLIHEL
jgi:hypothetical protein